MIKPISTSAGVTTGSLADGDTKTNNSAKGFAWFDFDGTLCAPVFWDNGKIVFGFEESRWVEFCSREKEEAYKFCVPMEPIIQFAKTLQWSGFQLGVLTASYSSGEKAAKLAWMERHGVKELFDEIFFVRRPSEKTEFMLQHAAQNGFRPDQITLVEDNYENAINAMSVGINGIHISHILTGVVIGLAK